MDAPESLERTIAGRYRLTRQLGQGGMGSVWRADDLTLGSPVAVKLIDTELAAEESVRARFYQEAKAAAALRSPHVVQVLDYGVDAGVPFIAMELLEGESLADRLARVSVFSHEETARIFGDVARAVRKAHEAGIVHRDLKPDNIFLVPNGDQEIAKVLDFGIAKAGPAVGGQSTHTRTGSLIGTPAYMSPEQARGMPVEAASDLWALGVIAFELVCGRLPFTADNPGELILQICAHPMPVPSEVADPVPPGFDAWFARAAARDPAERFPSAKDMAEALRTVLGVAPEPKVGPTSAPPDPEAISARPATMNGAAAFVSGVSAPKPRDGRSARAATALSAVSLAVALILAVVWLVRGRGTPDTTVVGVGRAADSAAPVVAPSAAPEPSVAPAGPAPSIGTAAPEASARSAVPAGTAASRSPASTASADPKASLPPAKKGKDRIGF